MLHFLLINATYIYHKASVWNLQENFGNMVIIIVRLDSLCRYRKKYTCNLDFKLFSAPFRDISHNFFHQYFISVTVSLKCHLCFTSNTAKKKEKKKGGATFSFGHAVKSPTSF